MLRILHIEDCLEDAFLIEQTVLSEGIEAHFIVVRDEAQFRSALERNKFDVVLADSGVPGFNGFKAIKAVREKFPGISYICLSGFDDSRHIEKNLAAGATDYILKNEFSRLIVALRREQERVQSRGHN
jgi:DNA-binding NarL/FixJ family response regulator